MARSLDAAQRLDLVEFVDELYTAAGYSTLAEWARDSGYPAPNLSNLRNGKGAIDGYNLLRLIRAAAERAGASPSELALKSSPTVNDRLAELSALVEKALRLLEAQAAAPGPERRSGAKPAGRNKKRATG